MKNASWVVLTCIVVAIVLGLASVALNEKEQQNNIAVQEETAFEFGLPSWLVWGMKEGEVRQQLNDDVSEYGDLIYILFSKEYRNCDVTEYYGFSQENALTYMNYTFNNDYFNEKNEYYDIFVEQKAKMIELYGEPVIDDEQWVNDRYKNDEYMMYKAVEDGEYIAKAKWAADGYFCSIELNKGVSISYSINEDNT